jgi:hypothetical protein
MFLYTLSLHVQEANKDIVCHKYTSFALQLITYFKLSAHLLLLLIEVMCSQTYFTVQTKVKKKIA